MLIRFSPFHGVVPKADPTMLPQAAAQVAKNCRFTAGQLEAFNLPVEVYNPTAGALNTIYRFGQTTNSDTDYWFTSSNVVDFVKGAIANDTEERTFYTGDGFPKVTKADLATTSKPYPTAYYRMGIPAPADVIIATVNGAPTSETALAESRVYTYTFVDVMGNESPPAAPSNEVDTKVGQTVSLLMGPPPSGAFNFTSRRVYRSTDGEYLFVAELGSGFTAYDDVVPASDLGESLPTIDYEILPDDARGLTGMPNGMMPAHTDYDVYFNVPYKPFYPSGYAQTVDYPIVGMASFGASLVVLTTGVPYVMSGIDPQSVTVEKLAVPYACLSKKSICSALGGVIYAAADGLISIDASGPKVLTDQFFTRREWALLNPSSMMCCVWDERIFMFYDTGTVKGGLILDAVNGLTMTDVHATAAFTDPVTGSLFLAVNNKIVKWDAGSAGQFQWKSRRETIPLPRNFAYGQILATSFPITMNVYADNGLIHTQSVTNDLPFRLPAGFRARYWEVEILGSGRVLQVSLADSAAELQSV